MPGLTWSQVVDSDAYKALDFDGREQVRARFYDTYIHPFVPPDQLEVTRDLWEQRSNPLYGASGSGTPTDPYSFGDDEARATAFLDEYPEQKWVRAPSGDVMSRNRSRLEAFGDSLRRGVEQAKGYVANLLPNTEVERTTTALQNAEQGGHWDADIRGNPFFVPDKEPVDTEPLRKEQVKALAEVGKNTGEANRKQAGIPRSYESSALQADMGAANGFGESLGAIMRHPGAAFGTAVESVPAMLPALTVGAVTRNPGLAALVAGLNSGGVEYASGVSDYLQQQGINVDDEDAMAKLTPEQIDAALGYAHTRATIIGSIDAATGGLVSKNLIPSKMIRGFAAREAANMVAQTGVDMAAGAGGEYLGQEATGQKRDWNSILMEALGEGITKPGEIAAHAYRRANGSYDIPNLSNEDLADNVTSHPDLDVRMASVMQLAARGEQIDLDKIEPLPGRTAIQPMPTDLSSPTAGADAASAALHNARVVSAATDTTPRIDPAPMVRGAPLEPIPAGAQKPRVRVPATPVQPPVEAPVAAPIAPAAAQAAPTPTATVQVAPAPVPAAVAPPVQAAPDAQPSAPAIPPATPAAPVPAPATPNLGGATPAAEPSLTKLTATATEGDLNASLSRLTANQEAIADAPAIKASRPQRRAQSQFGVTPFRPGAQENRKSSEFASVLQQIAMRWAGDKDRRGWSPEDLAIHEQMMQGADLNDLSKFQEVQLSGKDRWRVKQLEKVLGKRIVFISPYTADGNLSPEMSLITSNANGVVVPESRPDVMFVTAESNKSPMSIIGHEFLHLLRGTDSALYDEFAKLAAARIKRSSVVYKQRIAQYEQGGLEHDTDDMDEEIFADFWGDLLSDDAFWQELAKREPSMFQKILSSIIEFLNAMVVKAGHSSDAMFKDIKLLRDKATDIFIRYSKQYVREDVEQSLEVQKQARDQQFEEAFAQPEPESDDEMVGQMMWDIKDGSDEVAQRREQKQVKEFHKNLGEEVRARAEQMRAEAEAGGHQYQAGDTVVFGKKRERVVLAHKMMVPDMRVWHEAMSNGATYREASKAMKDAPKVAGWFAHTPGFNPDKAEPDGVEGWATHIPEYAIHEKARRPTLSVVKASLRQRPGGAQAYTPPVSPLAVPVRQGYLGRAKSTVQRMKNSIERNFVDAFRDLREMQNYVQDQIGAQLPAWAQPWRQENLRHGAFVDARKKAIDEYFDPVAKLIEDHGYDRHDFEDYLWAKHVPERDAFLRSKLDPNQSAPQRLAGMTPAEAQAHIASLDPAKRRVFEQAAAHMKRLREHTLDVLLQSGQISQEHHDALLDQYKDYVPLRGLPEGSDPDQSVVNSNQRSGKGLSQSSSPLGKRAVGRVTPPSDILEEMLHDLDRALIGAEKQNVLKQLVGLISLHPDPRLWKVDPVTPQRKWVNGVLTIKDTNGDAKNQLILMHQGKPIRIEVRDPFLKAALIDMNNGDNFGWVMRQFQRATRWLSMVKTSLNPYFIFPNAVRDLQFAAMGLSAEQGRQVMKTAMRNYAFRNPWGALRQDTKGMTMAQLRAAPPLVRYAREFAVQGGKTGYTMHEDINTIRGNLNDLFTKRAKNKMDARTAKKAFLLTMDAIESVNEYVENATRLSAYAALREHGVDPKTAAAYAKDITVNFNRKGSQARKMSAAYLFFNPAVQGAIRTAKLAKNRKAQAFLGGMLSMSYAMALYSMHEMGDDDDGQNKYDKLVGDQAAKRSITIPLGGENKLTIPVAYGPNIFTHLGYLMAQATYRTQTGKDLQAGKLAQEAFVNTLSSMSPLPTERGADAVLPELGRIWYNVKTNTNDFGGKINYLVNENEKDKDAANWTKTQPGTAELYKQIARGINVLSSNPFEAEWKDTFKGYAGGLANLTGEDVKYLMEQGLGGIAKMASQSWTLAEKILGGDTEDIRIGDTPVLNSFVRTARTNEQQRPAYYDNIDEFNHLVAKYKKASGKFDDEKGAWTVEPDVETQQAMLEEHPWLAGAELSASTKEGKAAQSGSVMETEREVHKQIKDLRDEREQVMIDTTLALADRNRELRRIDNEIGELQKQFTTAFRSAESD